MPAILSTCLAISSKPDDHRKADAEEAALRVAQAAGEESLQPVVEELLRALEDVGANGRALGATGLVAGYCKTASGSKRDALQEHVDGLMTVSLRWFCSLCLRCGWRLCLLTCRACVSSAAIDENFFYYRHFGNGLRAE